MFILIQENVEFNIYDKRERRKRVVLINFIFVSVCVLQSESEKKEGSVNQLYFGDCMCMTKKKNRKRGTEMVSINYMCVYVCV